MKYSIAIVLLSMVVIASCMPAPQRRRHRPYGGHGGQGFGGGPDYYNQGGHGGGPGFGGQQGGFGASGSG